MEINKGPLFRTEICQANNDLPTRLVVTHMFPKLAKHERMKLVHDVHPLLHESRALTSAELKMLKITEMGRLPVYLKANMGEEIVEVPFARYFSPEETLKDLGLQTDLANLQKTIACNQFREFLRKVQHTGHHTRRGTVYDSAVSVQQGNQQGGIYLCRAALDKTANYAKHHLEIQRLNTVFAKVSDILLRAAFGEDVARGNDRMWAANASITPGSVSNHIWTHCQINYSKLEDEGKQSLGKKGEVHVDQHDVPTSLSFVFFLSSFPENYFPGRFIIKDAGLICSSATFGVLLFSGRHPHCGTGEGPASHPQVSPLCDHRPINVESPDNLDPKLCSTMRINAILYPNKQAWSEKCITSMYMNTDMLNPENLDILLRVFGTPENWYQWRMRYHIKEEMTETERMEVAAQEVVAKFGWEEHGVMHFPDVEVAELALKWSGKKDDKADRLYSLYLASNCGDRLPRHPEVPDDARLIRERARKEAKKNCGQKVQCPYIRKNGRCQIKYWLTPGFENGCQIHRKAEFTEAHTKAVAMDEESMDVKTTDG